MTTAANPRHQNNTGSQIAALTRRMRAVETTVSRIEHGKQVTAVSGAVVTPGTITGSAIAAGTITSGLIASGAIVAGLIAANAVTATAIAAQAVAAGKIAAGAVTAFEIAANTITAGQIAAGTITATQIATGTITATQIATGTITATQIAAGTIDATRLTIAPGGGNMIRDASFERRPNGNDPTTTWTQASGNQTINDPAIWGKYVSSGTATTAISTAQVFDGTKSVLVTSGNSGSFGVYQDVTIPSGMIGQKFVLSAWYYLPVGATARQVRTQINFTAVGGSVVSTIVTTSPNLVPGTWTRVVTTGTAPATTSFARCYTFLLNAAAAGETCYIDAVQFEQGDLANSFAPKPGEQTPGSITNIELADGVITTPKLVANEINADRIRSGTITATQIAANTITAGQIAANTITASQIAAGTIDATRLSIIVGGDNVIANSYFADTVGTLASYGWTVYTAGSTFTYTTAQKKIGANSMMVTTPGGGVAGGVIWMPPLASVDSVVAGTPVTVSAWVKVPSGQIFTIGNRILSTSNGYLTENNKQFTGTGLWQRVSNTYTYVTADHRVALQIVFGTAAPATTFYVDGVQVETGDVATAWSPKTGEVLPASITSAMILDGTIVGTDISNGTITSTNIAANTITASQIAANTITASQIAANTITAGQIVANTITAAQIAASTITATQIATGTITATQILAGSITGDRLTANTITAAQIAATTITAAQIAANTITASQIAAGTITSTEIAANTITASKIAANTITGAQIQAGSIGATELAAINITASGVTVGGVVSGSVAAGSITAAALATGTLSAATITLGASGIIQTSASNPRITLTQSAFQGVDSGGAITFKIDATTGAAQFKGTVLSGATGLGNFSDTITNTQFTANSISGANITDATLTATKIIANTITATQIAANAIGAGQLAANSVTAAAIQAGTITATQIASNSITADRLTTSTLSATTITLGAGGVFQTAASPNARVVLDSTGLKAYNASNVNTVAINSDGSASFTGTITMTAGTIPAPLVAGILGGGGNYLWNTRGDYDPNGIADGSRYSWTAFSSTISAAAGGRSGSNCFNVVATTASTTAFLYRNYNHVSALPTVAGRTYTFSAYSKLVSGSVQCRLEIRYSNGTFAYSPYIVPVSTDWTRHTFTFTVPAGVTSLGYSVLMLPTAIGDTVQWTDIQMEEGNVATSYAPKVGEILPGAVANTQLAASGLDATKITTGTLPVAQVPALDASKITTGSFAASFIPNLDAAKITTGTLVAARIPALSALSGQITNTQISNNAVDTPQLNANSVTAAQIAGLAVTAAKLNIVAGGGNLVLDSSFEERASGANIFGSYNVTSGASTIVVPAKWQAYIVGGSHSFNVSTTQAYNGTKSALMTCVSAATTADMYSGQTINNLAGYVGLPMTLSAYVRLAAGTAKNVQVIINWYNAANGTGSLLGQSTSTNVSPVTTGWKRAQVVGTAPAGAVSCIAWIAYIGSVTNDAIYVDGVQFSVGDVPEDYAPAQNDILPGAITTIHMADGTITAPKIVANAITATQIAANTITAAQIAGTTITAAQIATGTITATQIAGNTIDASKLTISVGGGNIVSDSSFERRPVGNDPTTVWSFSSGGVTVNDPALWTRLGSPTVSIATPPSAVHGTKAVLVTSTAAGDMGVFQTFPVPTAWRSTKVTITTYYYLNSVTTPRAVEPHLDVYDGANGTGTLVASIKATTYTAVQGQWLKTTVTGTIPATAVSMRVYGIIKAAGAAGEAYYVDAIQVEQGDVPTAFAPKNGEQVPGSITNIELADGAITAPKIVANSITADRLTTSTLSATTITLGSGGILRAAGSGFEGVQLDANGIKATDVSNNVSYQVISAAQTIGSTNYAAGSVAVGGALGSGQRIEITRSSMTMFGSDAVASVAFDMTGAPGKIVAGNAGLDRIEFDRNGLRSYDVTSPSAPTIEVARTKVFNTRYTAWSQVNAAAGIGASSLTLYNPTGFYPGLPVTITGNAGTFTVQSVGAAATDGSAAITFTPTLTTAVAVGGSVTTAFTSADTMSSVFKSADKVADANLWIDRDGLHANYALPGFIAPFRFLDLDPSGTYEWPSHAANTTMTAGSLAGATSFTVGSTRGLIVGRPVIIGGTQYTVASITSATAFVTTTPATPAYAIGTVVTSGTPPAGLRMHTNTTKDAMTIDPFNGLRFKLGANGASDLKVMWIRPLGTNINQTAAQVYVDDWGQPNTSSFMQNTAFAETGGIAGSQIIASKRSGGTYDGNNQANFSAIYSQAAGTASASAGVVVGGTQNAVTIIDSNNASAFPRMKAGPGNLQFTVGSVIVSVPANATGASATVATGLAAIGGAVLTVAGNVAKPVSTQASFTTGGTLTVRVDSTAIWSAGSATNVTLYYYAWGT